MGFITYTKIHSIRSFLTREQDTLPLQWTKQFEQVDDRVGIFLAGHAYFNVVLWPSAGLLPGCPSSGESATASRRAGLVAKREAKGLSCELECSDRIRGHQPSQSMSALLYARCS